MSQTILQKADEIINGERASDYGRAHVNMQRIADMWSAYLGRPVSIEDVSAMMILLKVSRLANTPKLFDSWMDIAGYVGVWDKAMKGE